MSVWHWCYWETENLPQKSYYVRNLFMLFERMSHFPHGFIGPSLCLVTWGLRPRLSAVSVGQGSNLSCVALGIHTQAEQRWFGRLIHPAGLWDSSQDLARVWIQQTWDKHTIPSWFSDTSNWANTLSHQRTPPQNLFQHRTIIFYCQSIEDGIQKMKFICQPWLKINWVLT